ncbi:MAG: LytTR family transcriptional regulator [Lachnospiraceae bacterium]|nr:LytTR family transcriptional regulator [Lachnospiraceae bacterium]
MVITTLPVSASTAVLEKEHLDLLMRCHECFLVNPKYIMEIKRFTVTLSNGIILPIPEKKYTALKKTVSDCRQSQGPSP